MIIIKLEGGLGNQMFQYALGRNLSLIHKVPLKFDLSYLKNPNQSQRAVRIDNFKTLLVEATKNEISFYDSIFQKTLDKIRIKKKNVLEKNNVFDPSILSINDGYFYGHWNSEKYFEKNKETIKNDFTIKKPLSKNAEDILNKIKSSPNSTSIHIRRGDYVSIKKIADIHGILPVSYYEKAIDKIIDKFPQTTFFIFSDDMEWVKNNFPKKYPAVFVSDPNIPDYEELILMSLCNNNIIANSTFSWWAAWMNNNLNKLVIAPQDWFIDKSRDTNDLIPKTWNRI